MNEDSVHEYDLCGDKSELPQKTFYSHGRSIHMEFHTEAVEIPNNMYKGFTGKFSFIDSSTSRFMYYYIPIYMYFVDLFFL